MKQAKEGMVVSVGTGKDIFVAVAGDSEAGVLLGLRARVGMGATGVEVGLQAVNNNMTITQREALSKCLINLIRTDFFPSFPITVNSDNIASFNLPGSSGR